jgi:hypothetical protein
MSLDIQSQLNKVDNILISNGLYSTATYEDSTDNLDNYNPATGEYEELSKVVHSFNCVFMSQDSNNDKDNSSGVSSSIIVLPSNLEFEVQIDQIYTLKGLTWQVASFEQAPQDSIYTINLRRK